MPRHAGAPIIALSAGTVHKPPPLDDRGYPILASVAGARYLVARGVPPALVLAETCSYDTIGNAYFSRVVHVAPRGFRRLLVITSEFHRARAEAVFRWVYGLPPAGYALAFEAVADAGVAPADLAARRRKAAAGPRSLASLSARVASLAELHRWLFTEHGAYAVGRGDGGPADGRWLGTY